MEKLKGGISFQVKSKSVTMAFAIKKLFKSSEHRLGDEGTSRKSHNNNNNNTGSPAHHPTRRFFGGHHCSPRNSRRDSKISPAETGPIANKNGMLQNNGPGDGRGGGGNGGAGGVLGVVFKSKSSSKNGVGGGKGNPAAGGASDRNGNRVSDTVVKHNQAVRTRRLMKEFQDIAKYSRLSDTPPFTVELVEDNLYEWNIRLFQIDPESDLYRDMRESGLESILLNVAFPDNFPFSPPFMRVISPHIEKGFVMEGGAICMELLTPRGWASAYTVEAVIMQFAASLVKGQGRVARKCKSGKEFNRKLAEASFRSLVKTHEKYGWVTPPLADG